MDVGSRVANRQSDLQILQGVQRNIHAADEMMNKTLEQVDQQGEQIRGIDRDVDGVSSTMDQAGVVINGMNNPLSLLWQEGGYAGPAEAKWMWRDTYVPSPVFELSKRNPIRWNKYQSLADTIKHIGSKKEDRRILCKIRLPGRKKQEIEFNNPADAVEQLQGILMLQQQQVAPAVGPRSRMSSSSSSEAAPYMPPHASPRAAPRSAATRQPSPEEAVLHDICAALDSMHEKTQQMNWELDRHNQMLPAISKKMEREEQRVGGEVGRLRKMQGR